MSKEELLDETWMQVGHHSSFDPIEEVTVIPADQAPLPPPRRHRRDEEEESAGAAAVAKLKRMPNADDLHQQQVNGLTDAIKAAIDFLELPKTGAIAWAKSMGYDKGIMRDKGVLKNLNDAVSSCMDALHLIDVQERE